MCSEVTPTLLVASVFPLLDKRLSRFWRLRHWLESTVRKNGSHRIDLPVVWTCFWFSSPQRLSAGKPVCLCSLSFFILLSDPKEIQESEPVDDLTRFSIEYSFLLSFQQWRIGGLSDSLLDCYLQFYNLSTEFIFTTRISSSPTSPVPSRAFYHLGGTRWRVSIHNGQRQLELALWWWTWY